MHFETLVCITYQYGFDYDIESAESLPACILQHLGESHLSLSAGRIPENEFHLEKFLLKYGRLLKTIVLSYLGDKNSEIANLLLTFPRASRPRVDLCSKSSVYITV